MLSAGIRLLSPVTLFNVWHENCFVFFLAGVAHKGMLLQIGVDSHSVCDGFVFYTKTIW